MANLRTGICGNYYGSYFNQSEPLTTAEMQTNAIYIYAYLSARGWTKQAISALLGNMQAESSINPGRWQGERIGVYTNNGYGLVQWTPVTKYTDWCNSKGFEDPSEMDNNLSRIIYELENNIQWGATSTYNYSFETFATDNSKGVAELAKAFLLNYERPADQSASVQIFRAGLAQSWYEYLEGEPVPDIPATPTKKKRKGYNFVIFNRRKRFNRYG